MTHKIKLKKGDEVIVLSGKDKGKTGKISLVKPQVNKAIVAGINKVKKIKNLTRIKPAELLTKRCQYIFQILLIMTNPWKKELEQVLCLMIKIIKSELINKQKKKFNYD